MAVREIAVFGLGRMGKAVAETFSENGGQVIAIDIDQGKVDDIADKVAYAIRADINDIDDVKALGISNVDAAVVTLGENFETTIMAIIACKEMGIPLVYAKAKDRTKGKILEKIGADKVMYPEEEVGGRVAMTLRYGNLHEYFNLEGDINLVETDVPKKWIGKSLIELDLRKKYGFNVIALRKGGKLTTAILADEPLKAGYQIVVIGHKDKLSKIMTD